MDTPETLQKLHDLKDIEIDGQEYKVHKDVYE